MNNKAFTLVEILAVVAILAIIFVLTFPTVNKLISQGKETVYQTQINKILTATSDFSLKNVSYLPDNGKKSYVTLGELKYEGLIPANFKNPNNGEYFKDSLVTSIENVGANYKYNNDNSILKGSYLYTVETNRNDSKNLLPVISIDSIESDSNGNYVLTLDLNEEFIDNSVTATSNNGVDLTSKIRKYILINDKVVDSVDSSKSSIYKINYSVVDEEGYANASTLSVIVADTTPPIINLPESTKISTSINSYNLLKNVSCIDNSEYCDINYTGEIDYGVAGKYVITYTSTDPSGNTSTKKRVITISNS